MRLSLIGAAGALLLQAVTLPAAAPLPRLEDRVEPSTTAPERVAFLRKHREETIAGRLGRPLDAEAEKDWPGAYWAAQLTQDRRPLVLDAIRRALRDGNRSEEFERATLQAAHGLFPAELSPEARMVLRRTRSEKNFAMAAYYLLRADNSRRTQRLIENQLRERFPAASTHPILRALGRRLVAPAPAGKRPPLAELLAYRTDPPRPVLFSLQRPDRTRTGLALVRHADGRFLRQPDGTLVAVPQLALAVSNLPGTITNGNTPQGVLSISGSDVSTNVFIGRTPLLVSRLPFEAAPEDFFHGTRTDKAWSPEVYRTLLPPSWRTDEGMLEAYDAGEAGRGEIVIHGTTIDPEFYRAEPYYPQTPSMGCLCAVELWSAEDGRALASDQLALARAWREAAGAEEKGWLIVAELEPADRPVTIDDVRLAVLEAERLSGPSPEASPALPQP